MKYWLPSLLLAAVPVAQAADIPADTYFAMAITENSHNHVGHNLLFLDFQKEAYPAAITPRTVIAPYGGDITMDGKLNEWDPNTLTRIQGRVMNNYPLSEFYDAVPTEITIGSRWDEENIYFAVQFEDANHDASINRNRWYFKNGKWSKQAHVKPNPGAPVNEAVNADYPVAGAESEDRVFFMFPIVDQQHAFRDGSFGCSAYCHTNLIDSPDPHHEIIGDGVVAMHTSIEGDKADIWHWTSTRSMPMNTLKDAHLVYGEGSFNGRIADDGAAPDKDNDRKKLKMGETSEPAYVSDTEYKAGLYAKPGHRTERIAEDDRLAITPEMKFADGVSLPYSLEQTPTGSRSDVTAVAYFDVDSKRWTVEFKRKRDTGDANDYAFVAGTDATPPQSEPVTVGDAAKGKELYAEKCASCHGDKGEGTYENGQWIYPRNQRASGAQINKTASIYRPKRLGNLAWPQDENKPLPQHLMTYVQVTPQQAEDIAAWLQQQHMAVGEHNHH